MPTKTEILTATQWINLRRLRESLLHHNPEAWIGFYERQDLSHLHRREQTGMTWADEIGGSISPRLHLEAFYTLAAMQLGDPESNRWLLDRTEEFHQLYEQYVEPQDREDRAQILVSYIIWYDRNKPKT